ncbi:MAG: mechanosensitive ion channel domain-containing protein [Pseudomonadota bacterium]
MDLSNFDLQALLTQYGPMLLAGAIRVLGALIVLVIGLRVASWLGRRVKEVAVTQDAIDDTLGSFFGSIVKWLTTIAVIIAVLQVFGVQATSFVAVLGAMTLAIGLSLQGALGNIASGIMIMTFRPYRLGDYVELAGTGGTVRDINLFQTILSAVDNVKIIVPNSQAIDGVIKNYSGFTTRRVDIVFNIDYEDDMDVALGAISDLVAADTRIRSEPEPFVRVTNLGASAIDITVRVWTLTSDYWDVRFDLTKKGKEALDAAGITIPYPHTVMVQKPTGIPD